MADIDKAEPDQDIDSLSFEEAFRRLDEMAASLDEGGLDLAVATARYEEGMNLVRRCSQLLDEAELKITSLKDAYAAPQGDQDWPEEV